MVLNVKKRQQYLKFLGFYDGAIDGIVGQKTRNAYLKLQSCYFDRKKDIDGKYGKNTDILLRNAYNVKKYCKDFKLSEFKCGCGRKYCTGYPAVIDVRILKALQYLRDNLGKTVVTSALRCKKYNNSLDGSSAVSRHLNGSAVDFKGEYTSTAVKRSAIAGLIRKHFSPRYVYYGTPNMGTAIHFDFN